MFRSFFTTIFRGSSAVLCAVTIPPADLRSSSLYYYTVCGRMCMSSVRVWFSCLLVICLSAEFVLLRSMWPHVYVICPCLVFLFVGELLTSRSPTNKNTKHAQVTYTCDYILCNSRNSTNANQREE